MKVLRAILVALVLAGWADAGHAADGQVPAWREPVIVATGDAHRGPWRMNRSDFDYVDDPTVALRGDGDALVAWVDQVRSDVLFQRYAPDGSPRLDQPVNVSRTPDVFSWLPRVAVSPDDADTVHALWQEIIFSGGSHGGDILYARSTDGGRTFEEPLNLSRSEAGDGKGRLSREYWHNGSLDIAAGPGGVVYAAWTEYEGRLWLARSADAGASFDEPVLVAGGGNALPARGPSLALGPAGTVHLAWTVGGDRRADIRYARSTDGGETFGEMRLVAPGGGHADAPKLAVDDRGVLHLAYGVSDAGPLRRYAVAYTRRAPGAGTFEPPRRISAPLPDGYASAGYPYLAVAGEDRVTVAAELFTGDARRRPKALGLMRSRDGGDTFTPPALVDGTAGPGVNGSLQGLLMDKLDMLPDGTIALVNSKFDPGQDSRVRLRRRGR